jgi:membrane protein required for colicin V production
MTWFDLLIVAVLAVSVISAFLRGFLLEVFALAGLFFGLVAAAKEYKPVALWLESWTGPWGNGSAAGEDVASLVAFLVIALGIMLLATLVGRLLRSTASQIGLGIIDRMLGAALGFVKGCAVITLAVMAITAFLPQSGCLRGSRLAPYFLEAANQASKATPVELGQKIREDVAILRSAETRK